MIDLDPILKSDFFSPLDVHFAGFMEKLSGAESQELFLGAALLSRCTREGHICLDLSLPQATGLSQAGEGIAAPEKRRWVKALQKNRVVGSPGERRPLILDHKARLYLYRYWEYQEELAKALRARIGRERQGYAMKSLVRGLQRIFPEPPDRETDWQKVAAFAAARNRFCVITGGPGTGKTTTVAKILALVVEQSKGQRLRAALVSPTGKGAARLQEAMKRTKASLACDEAVKALMPEGASTIHRLLGPARNSPYFRHNAQHPLPVDLLVADEASMVDLALMSKLLQALPAEARLILLGDKDQLSSVEPGAVLGDICDTGRAHPFSEVFCAEIQEATGYAVAGAEGAPPLSDSIVQLTRSYRFRGESGIAEAGRFINLGDGEGAFRTLQHGAREDLKWKTLPAPRAMAGALKSRVEEAYQDLFEARDPSVVFQRLERFRILCALREGPFGVHAVNLAVERILRERKPRRAEGKWYRGRPVLITRNDYTLQLYNGDVGVALPDPASGGDLRVFFPTQEGSFRCLHPLRLPEHESVYAMTVHKSQGSEFDRILLILPDRDSPVLTRELLYTAVTRAREHVEIWGHEDVVQQAVSRRIERMSGLRDALWEK